MVSTEAMQLSSSPPPPSTLNATTPVYIKLNRSNEIFKKKKVLDWTQGKILAFLSLHSVNLTRLDHFIRQIPGQALIFCHAANYKQFKTAKLIFSSILINQTLCNQIFLFYALFHFRFPLLHNHISWKEPAMFQIVWKIWLTM